MSPIRKWCERLKRLPGPAEELANIVATPTKQLARELDVEPIEAVRLQVQAVQLLAPMLRRKA